MGGKKLVQMGRKIENLERLDGHFLAPVSWIGPGCLFLDSVHKMFLAFKSV